MSYTCAVELQQQSILELQSSIRTLTKEVHELRAVVAALQEPAKAGNDPTTEALLKEVRELKTAIAAMQENYLSSSSHRDAESNKNFKDAYSWSDVVRRKPKGKGKGKGSGGKGTGEKGVGSDQRGRKQPDAQGPSMQSASIQRAHCEQQKTRSQRQFVPLPGKRKVWGTHNVCPSSTVRNTIVKHFSPQISINVKRKFKLGSGNNKIIGMW